ncbi:MAG: hypothetical protein EXR37_05120 [Limnohabitans sp.]|nr:hypothetical protein [Limnohabitans sp.]
MTSNRTKFFSFLETVTAIEHGHHHKLPDIDAQVLLMRVAMANDKKQPLNVTQAMNLKNIGSPAMLHRKINDLLNLNMIELVFEGSNRRTKYLLPTSQALDILDEMADAAANVYLPPKT